MHTQSDQHPSSLRQLTTCILGSLYLLYLWSRNYYLLGELYGYSIIASACGHLRDGLLPYRDFTTSLQSLTIYTACAAV
jgi:hypothetical protein